MKKKYCVIGSPVAHSLSPAIHNTLYEIYSLTDCEYSAVEVFPGGLADFTRTLGEKNIRGFNVTMPHKVDILPFLAYRDESVHNGANTIAVTKDGLRGYSTDAAGFYRSLTEAGGDYSGANVVFIGNGAVAQTLVHHAAQKSPRRITVLGRDEKKAGALADGKLIFAGDMQNIADYMQYCDLLINTTPLGMHGVAGDFSDLRFIERLPESACVCDLIYAPPQTSLLKTAARRGLRTLNGLPMLVWQAFYAFEIFFDIMPTAADYATVWDNISAK